MTREQDTWDDDYATRGMLWGGAPDVLPDLPAGARLLELGCGSGKTFSALVSGGWNVVAFDFSPSAVKLCRRCVGSSASGYVATADARYLPFRDGIFDAVIAFHIIGHMVKHDRKRSIAEAARVLRVGGSLVFRDFSSKDFRMGSGDETECNTFCRGTGIITHYFLESEVTDLFCAFHRVSFCTRPWTMRVRGKNLEREEVEAVFLKER